MSTPVYHCPKGHFHRVIFGLGPLITDYPEQITLAGVKQGLCPWYVFIFLCGQFFLLKPSPSQLHSNPDQYKQWTRFLKNSTTTLWDKFGIDANIIPIPRDFPRADSHELVSPDPALLHKAIKGTFRDPLVHWVGGWLEITYEKAEAD